MTARPLTVAEFNAALAALATWRALATVPLNATEAYTLRDVGAGRYAEAGVPPHHYRAPMRRLRKHGLVTPRRRAGRVRGYVTTPAGDACLRRMGPMPESGR